LPEESKENQQTRPCRVKVTARLSKYFVDAALGRIRWDTENIRQNPWAENYVFISTPSQGAPYKIGQNVKAKGVFMGRCELVDIDSNRTGRQYSVFAAPEDLKRKWSLLGCIGLKSDDQVFTFREAAKEIAALGKYYGHPGKVYESQHDLRSALARGDYKEEWIIPPVEMLGGWEVGDGSLYANSLYKHQWTGALGKTVQPAAMRSERGWYVSCTQSYSDGTVDTVGMLCGGVGRGCVVKDVQDKEARRFARKNVRLFRLESV
jgi:hypothetical protein